MKSFFLFFLLSSTLFAQTIYIIANKNFPANSLTQKEIKQIYLDKKRYIKGAKLLPLNYTHNSKLRELFEKTILQKSRKNLEGYWLKAHYKGHRPPKVLKSQDSVISYIKEIDTALGYVDTNISKSKEIKLLLEVSL